MAKTSIHYSAVKPSSEIHNNRKKELEYVRADLSHLNEKWQSDTIHDRLNALKLLVKEKTGRKMQAKATPIREAVIVIKPNTSMNELKALASRFKEKWGLDTFQIYIHKDEGHYTDSGEWKGNYHAHFVTDFVNHETGKSIKLNRQDMSEMQDITAEALQMERGESSGKKHLSAIQFKIKAEAERLRALGKEIKQARELLECDLKPRKNFLGVYKHKDVENVLKTLKMAQIEINKKNEAIKKLQSQYANEVGKSYDAIKSLQVDNAQLKALIKKMLVNPEFYKEKRENMLRKQSDKIRKRGRGMGF